MCMFSLPQPCYGKLYSIEVQDILCTSVYNAFVYKVSAQSMYVQNVVANVLCSNVIKCTVRLKGIMTDIETHIPSIQQHHLPQLAGLLSCT